MATLPVLVPPVRRPVLAGLVGLILGGCATAPLGPLLVTLPNGGVEVADLEGTRVVLETGGPGLVSRQPTWSPDGRLAVWTVIDQNAGEVTVRMGDAENQRRLDAGTAPFFYLPDPGGDRVAYLGNAPSGQGVALGLIDVAAGEARLIDGGAPYYLDWAAGGERLVIHVANRVLAFLDLEGNRSELAITPGLFQAPEVLPEGDILVVEAGPPQALVMLDPEGRRVRSIAEVEGLSMFTTEGGRVAFTDSATGAALGALRVVALEGGEPVTVHEGGVAAMEWSPDGDRLLFFTIEEATLVPHVWDGEDIDSYPAFAPSVALVTEYLPFWDQYLRTLSLWSPAGDAFAVPSGEGNILVQELSEPSFRVVGPGTFASWNPMGSEG